MYVSICFQFDKVFFEFDMFCLCEEEKKGEKKKWWAVLVMFT